MLQLLWFFFTCINMLDVESLYFSFKISECGRIQRATLKCNIVHKQFSVLHLSFPFIQTLTFLYNILSFVPGLPTLLAAQVPLLFQSSSPCRFRGNTPHIILISTANPHLHSHNSHQCSSKQRGGSPFNQNASIFNAVHVNITPNST